MYDKILTLDNVLQRHITPIFDITIIVTRIRAANFNINLMDLCLIFVIVVRIVNHFYIRP